MSRVMLDQTLRIKLNGLNQQVELYDEAGETIGRFLPEEEYLRLLASRVNIPYGSEEIERRRKTTGGTSLEAFWNRMGSS